MSLTFVVGTGRCGSTILSKALHTHPDILSLSEFFASLRNRAFPEGPIDGERFWRMLSAPDPAIDAMVRNGLRTREQVYPYDTGRFGRLADVPAICHMTLPELTDDPDGLYDELAAELPNWPLRPVVEHYRDLFGWLARRFGRQTVVERSGTSLNYVHRLRAMFPEARFVHIFRNGPDCALSMSRHFGFRLMMLPRTAARVAGVPVPGLIKNHLDRLPEDYQRFFRGDYSPELIMNADLPVRDFGEFWSSMIQHGVRELSGLDPADRLDLRYERMVAEPTAQFATLAAFLGVPADQPWLDRVGKLMDGSLTGSAQRLDPPVREELLLACAPGEEALAPA
ncbi:sulfotransferase family protein [Plantactinospora endophytica]|uniref:Sulfotransferase n=1 Tax=Plantactinospora endophytica TaxID=673535 RepID=A0ABQ4EBL8_9ACTN|nr:sulfotransferase [Plantactinospora endophytica]GIG92130.1 hypothetical protein Pen02_70660 [Plantactinospora endophytica]